MNRIALAFLIGCSVASYSVSADEHNWKARSTEGQYSKRSEITEKSSKGVKAFSSASSATRQHAAAKVLSSRTVVDDPDFWIYDAWITLDVDTDGDGYYSGFSVEFDADTIYSHADVYARLYLSRGDEDFYEYHTTADFPIDGEDSTDSFVVETDLVDGFPTGDYELLIELYDATTNQLVASLDGYDDDDLYLIPLESDNHEYREPVVVVTEHGGSFGWWSVLGLIGIWATRKSFGVVK
ncbi:choice-of-anchor H family protein [Neptunicella marina]|uniref:Choice-of-anchor H family protein n=1 Tax=Neptunicella marina TaxID=2125989 RepID=A0A8J6IS80_9ALTE|nr:choice-of-anchor H family protein [Neptunicella marina]MBC3766510.1 choice-of-anchor H family protein [Neptunicella marina]